MTPLVRREDWPERLGEAFAASARQAFEPGVHDCGLFAADCVAAVTGVDLAAAWRGLYTTEAAGVALVAGALGARTLAGVPRRLGLKRVHPAFARRGDLALLATAHGGGLAIFDGPHVRGPGGRVSARTNAVRAWSVG